jgi:hypothetical protein
MVPAQHSQEMQRLLGKQKLDWHKLPQIPEDYYTFAGEIPWCETFPNNSLDKLEIDIGHCIKKLPHIEVRFYRKGKRLNEELIKKLLQKLSDITEEEKLEQAFLSLLEAERVTYREFKTLVKRKETLVKTIPVLLPVRVNHWESYHSGVNPGQLAIIPARDISETVGLLIHLPDWDMCDADGRLASVSIKSGDLWRTGHSLCYLRRDVLDEFLQREGFDFIWAFWGARDIRLDTEDLSKSQTVKHLQKKFQRIYRYEKGRVIAGRASEHY